MNASASSVNGKDLLFSIILLIGQSTPKNTAYNRKES